MMWWTTSDWSWGWGIAMLFGMLVFWGLVAWALVSMVRAFNRPVQNPPGPQTTLAQRFASGEIDETEYRARLSTLRHTSDMASTWRRSPVQPSAAKQLSVDGDDHR